METFRLAHLSDLHLRTRVGVPVSSLLNKRAFGYASWQRRRQQLHLPETLEALVEDLHRQKVDHVAITGDLVNIALPDEFEAAGAWLHKLALPERLTVIPGNHDAYVPRAWRQGWRHWQPFMSDDGAKEGDEVTFPFQRERGPLTLIGVSSAVPTAPLMASGRVGAGQAEVLREVLQRALSRDCFRVILIHHSPAPRVSSIYKRLRDSARVRRVIEIMGAELVLSGHEHQLMFHSLVGPTGPVPAFCAPSASLLSNDQRPRGGYAIYTIGRGPHGKLQGGWHLEVEYRRFDPRQDVLTTEFIAQVEPAADRRTLVLAHKHD